MTVRRVLILLVALSLAPTAGGADSRDPYDLLEEARARLQAGELAPAQKSLDALAKLLAETPEWDPDGNLVRQVIPSLQTRMRGIRRAVRRLDEIYQAVWVSRTPPERLVRTASVRAYLDWSTGLVLELQQERDRVIESLPAAEDRTVVYETQTYERLRLVLETGVVSRMNGFAAVVTSELESEDERRRRLHAQLAAIDVVDPERLAERERLVRDLERSRERIERYLDAFAALVNEGAAARGGREDPRVRAVNDVFSSLLEQELQAVGRSESQTSSEQRARLADVERYRQVNSVLAGAAIAATDRSSQIDALARTIDDLQVVESAPEEPMTAEEDENGSPGPALALAAALIAAMGGLVLWRQWWNPSPADPSRVDAVVADTPVAAGRVGDSSGSSAEPGSPSAEPGSPSAEPGTLPAEPGTLPAEPGTPPADRASR